MTCYRHMIQISPYLRMEVWHVTDVWSRSPFVYLWRCDVLQTHDTALPLTTYDCLTSYRRMIQLSHCLPMTVWHLTGVWYSSPFVYLCLFYILQAYDTALPLCTYGGVTCYRQLTSIFTYSPVPGKRHVTDTWYRSPLTYLCKCNIIQTNDITLHLLTCAR